MVDMWEEQTFTALPHSPPHSPFFPQPLLPNNLWGSLRWLSKRARCRAHADMMLDVNSLADDWRHWPSHLWCSVVSRGVADVYTVFQMCPACLQSVSSVSWCVMLSVFLCFMCCRCVRMCAQCVKCVTSVCTCVPLTCVMCLMCLATLYCVPYVFRSYLQCARCVTMCCTVRGAVLPCVFAVFACVCTLHYLLIQVCRTRVSWLMCSMMSYVRNDTKSFEIRSILVQ